MKQAPNTWDKGYRIRFLAISLLIVALVAAVAVIFPNLAQRERAVKEYLLHANELRVAAETVAKAAVEAADGNAEAVALLGRTRRQFDEHLRALGEGHAGADAGGRHIAGVAAVPAPARDELEALSRTWGGVTEAIDTILARGERITRVAEVVREMEGEDIPALRAEAEALGAVLVAGRAPQEQVLDATRVALLLERMRRDAVRLLQGGVEAVTAADSLGRSLRQARAAVSRMAAADAGELQAMDPTLRAELAAEREARLAKLQEGLADLAKEAELLLEAAPEIFQVRAAAAEVFKASSSLRREAEALAVAVGGIGADSLLMRPMTGYLLGGLAVVLGLLLAVDLLRRARAQRLESERQAAEAEERNRRTQDAILTLLDEMSTLADGDLTVQATVTEEITGAIADSVNYAIEALRELVGTIRRTAEQVAGSAHETRAIATHLAEAAEQQAERIEEATGEIHAMASTIDQVSRDAQSSAEVARRSVDIAHRGAETVRRTIEGMDATREQIQETAKRIKRLGESSQEIGSIIGLINDIADQTNILALNAAIQAAMAGEAGRGFAVVADEVQRLAERSAEATKQIETLIKTIQADTNEAVTSMEETTAGVVQGARLAEEAGAALGEIEEVSRQLAGLVERISQASVEQAEAASRVANTMSVIRDITREVAEGSQETARSVGNLTELAAELRTSVAGFKLPEEGGDAAPAPEGCEAVPRRAAPAEVAESGSFDGELAAAGAAGEDSGAGVERRAGAMDAVTMEEKERRAVEAEVATLGGVEDDEIDLDLGGEVPQAGSR